jgi:predicted RecA/RadA family phage recombinase
MKNYIQEGRFFDVVAGVGGLVSGAFYITAALQGVVQASAAQGETTSIDTRCVAVLPKATGTAWVQGDPLYWDAVASKFTKVSAGNRQVGFAALDAASGDATGSVAFMGSGNDLRMVFGQQTTVAAVDTVVTGLAKVVSAVANLEDVPVLTCDRAQAVIGDQAGAPVSGSIQIKTFKPTASGDATPIAATTFGKKVNWIAIGY